MPPDLSRHVEATPDSEFTVTIEDALERYARAGLPRTPRSIQRYCAKGHLECRLIETPFGEKYLIKPGSVDKHIAYIEEVRPAATGPDMPRRVAAPVVQELEHSSTSPGRTTGDDQSRHVAADGRYVTVLEGEVEFLRSQVVTKDAQIRELTERSRETNMLIAGLQKMLAPLLIGPSRSDDRG